MLNQGVVNYLEFTHFKSLLWFFFYFKANQRLIQPCITS
ncbi:hypothetical protein RV03_GL001084 [Enterococcus gallinarum]|nr:hypothetical protein RV03_GL001084 [Enterococcus gallinarum]